MKKITFILLLFVALANSVKCYSQEDKWNNVFSFLDGTWDQVTHKGKPISSWNTGFDWGYLFEDESLKHSLTLTLTNNSFAALEYNVTFPGTYKFEYRHRLETAQDDIKVRLFYTEGDVMVGNNSNRVYVTEPASVGTAKLPAESIVSTEIEIKEAGVYNFGYELSSFGATDNKLYVGAFELYRKDDGTVIEKEHQVIWSSYQSGSLIVKDEEGNELKSPAMVKEGSTITIEDHPAKYYKLVELEANGESIIDTKSVEVNTNVTITALFEKGMYTLTFDQPEHGSILITPAVEGLESGAQVEAGTKLFVMTEPHPGYVLESVKANDTPLNIDGRFISFIMEEDTKVVAVFAPEGGTSISEVEKNAVYYNSQTNELYAAGKDVEIYDMTGVLLLKKNNAETLNLSDFNAGVYTAVVNGEIFKFVKK